jgi:hypothetical protein
MSFEDDKAAGNVTNQAASSSSFDDSSVELARKTKNQTISALPALPVRLKDQEYLAFKWRYNSLIY